MLERSPVKLKIYQAASTVDFCYIPEKRKIPAKNGKVVSTCRMKDLFGSILHLALQGKIDMIQVIKYPLTPVPLSQCNVDGSMPSAAKPTQAYSYQQYKGVSTSPN